MRRCGRGFLWCASATCFVLYCTRLLPRLRLEACKTGFRVCVLSQWIVEKLKYMPASIQSPESDAVFQWIVGQGHRARDARAKLYVFLYVLKRVRVFRVCLDIGSSSPVVCLCPMELLLLKGQTQWQGSVLHM